MVTVPSVRLLPVPASFWTDGQLASTRPLRAPTKTYLPAGEPLARRPSTFTFQARRGVLPVARTTRRGEDCVVRKCTRVAARAAARWGATEARVEMLMVFRRLPEYDV